MKIQGKFLAAVAPTFNENEVMVTLTWASEEFSMGFGRVVCRPEHNELSRWEEAVARWNRGGKPSEFARPAFDILRKHSCLLLNEIMKEVLR